MTRQIGTLWLLGLMALAPAAGCIETVHDRGGGPSQSCLDLQYFTVDWGVDHGPGTIALTCSAIAAMASHVELSTNAAPPNDVLIPSYNLYCQDRLTCTDGSPCNLSADTASGIPVGTYVGAASLVASDGTVLSTAPGPGAAYGITSCDGAVLQFPFTIQ